MVIFSTLACGHSRVRN